jgi:hypothetical protein
MIAAMPTPAELAAAFWARYREAGEVDRATVRELAIQAVGDGGSAEAANKALFLQIVEPLADSFDPGAAHAFVDAFAEVVDVARRHPAAAELDRELAALGLTNGKLAARAHAMLDAHHPDPIGDPSLVVVLSQVNFGAEVAITSTVIAGVLARLPRAELLHVAPAHVRGLFAGNPRVRFAAVEYQRRGDLLTRLNAWPAARRIVREATAGLRPDDWLLIDTDSRISQTNLLPLAPDARTRYFPKRTIEAPPLERLAELAGLWVQRLAGLPERPQPTLWLPEAAATWALQVRNRLAPHANRWAVVNLGVGGNPAKGLGPAFEACLLRGLLDRGVGVLLARGISEAEYVRPDTLAADLAAAGADVRRIPSDNSLDQLAAPGRRQLVLWEASTERMAALVGVADLHVGYDSQGQHFAAALGTPGVTLFVPTGGERFFRRWSPHGPGPTRIVRVEVGTADALPFADAALQAAFELLGG